MNEYSQEELEFFFLKCAKHLLASTSVLQYTNTKQKKNMGFTPKQLGKLSDYASRLILGASLIGGLSNYKELLSNFLITIYEIDVPDEENSVRKDFKLAITSELRIMNSNRMNNTNKFYI